MTTRRIDTHILQDFEQKTQITDSFNSVEVKFYNSPKATVFSITFQGPFILLQVGQTIQYSIFIHFFTPNLEKDKVTITFRLMTNPEKCHTFKFSSAEDATTFRSDCFSIERIFQTFCLEELDSKMLTFSENYMVLMPNSKQPAYLPVTLQINQERNTSKAHLIITTPNEAANKKKKKDKNEPTTINISFELKGYPILEAMQPYKAPPEFPHSAGIILVSVEIKSTAKETYYIITRSKEEAMSLVMSISALCSMNGNFAPPKSKNFPERSKSTISNPPTESTTSKTLKTVHTAPQIPKQALPEQPIEETPQINEEEITRHRHHSIVLVNKPVPNKPTLSSTNKGKTSRAYSHKQVFQMPQFSEDDNLLKEIDTILAMKDQENQQFRDLVNTARLARGRTNTLSRRKTVTESPSRKGTLRVKDFAHIYDESETEKQPRVSSFEFEEDKTSLITQENRIDSLNQYEEMLAPIEKEINIINETKSNLQKERDHDIALPDFETFIENHVIKKEDIDLLSETTSSIELEKCIESLDSFESNFLTIEPSPEDKTTDEIVQESIELLAHPWAEKTGEQILASICDVNSIQASSSTLNFFEFATSESPKSLAIDELIAVTQSINLLGLNKISLDTMGPDNEKIGQKLLALVAAMFLNGQREFQRFNDLSSNDLDLLSSFANEIHTFICSMDDMKQIDSEVSKLSKPQEETGMVFNIGSVTCAMASLFLNTGLLIEFLRGAQKNDNWVNRYYLPTSFLASNELVQLSIAILTPLFRTTEFFFDIPLSFDVLANQPPHFIDTMIKNPIQGYLEVNPQILNSMNISSNLKLPNSSGSSTPISFDSLAMLSSSGINEDTSNRSVNFQLYTNAIQDQFQYYLKQGFRVSLFSDAQREFQFICEAASGCYNIDGWDQFVEVTKTLKTQSNVTTRNSIITEWISKGLENHLIHKWLLFLALDQDIVKKYYYNGCLFSDPFKLKYAISCIESTYTRKT